MRIPYIFLLLLTGFLSGRVFAQTDTVQHAVLKGIVFDSAQSMPLPAATVAVYKSKDTSLIAYTMADKKGAYVLTNIPVGIPLTIVTSFVGYKSYSKKFQIAASLNILDLGIFNMLPATGTLDEVVVTGAPPPVRMKGDTLEFNADAFKLDPNAQTEDLLRVLPGITIWADGLITVNGKEVSSVLVNGKPFFGSDARVATQNLPKNIVDKVQVYQKNKENAQKDSTTEINIKLKKGKDNGYFGKVGGGYGTGKNYELDGSINFFNRRTQLSLAGVRNSVNKKAGDMSLLLANHTFKGSGASVDYQSDFSTPGSGTFSAAGLFFQHDFLEAPDNFNNNRISGEYFISDNRQNLLTNTQTITTLNNGNYFRNEQGSENKTGLMNQQANVQYEKKSKHSRFYVHSLFNNQVLDDQQFSSSVIMDEKNTLLSTNTEQAYTSADNKNISVITGFNHTSGENKRRNPLQHYDVTYSIQLMDEVKKLNYRSEYVLKDNPALNRDLGRLYDNHNTKLINKLKLELPRMTQGIFKREVFPGFAIGLRNELEITNGENNSDLKDRYPPMNDYQVNTYLTNQRRELTYNIKPAITISESFNFKPRGKISNELSSSFSIGPQFFILRSTSQKQFQQFSKSYQKLIGEASFKLERVRSGGSINSVVLKISNSSQYPNVEQLAPLIDSANLNYIRAGNFFLNEQDTREMNLYVSHNSLKPKNTFNWYFTFTAGYINDYFANSNSIDTLGRVVNTIVNAEGYRYGRFNGQVRKSFKANRNQFQFAISPVLSLNESPVFINGVAGSFYNYSVSYKPAVTYSYTDRLTVNMAIGRTFSRYRSKGSDGMVITNAINQWELSSVFNCTRKISLGSNITHTGNSFNKAKSTRYTIWNANITCRMLKRNNAELKFSALDLLHQNTGLINYGSNNQVTHGNSNVLQQYFMLALAWYPRKFGK